jgi:alpha-amylase
MKNLILVIFLLANVVCFAQKSKNTIKGEVVYHLNQRSFYDSNGDFHGDLNGLKQKLPYLQDLGITSILLLPLYDAECYHNYFANDFEKIDSEFGTMEDYIALVKEIHRRGMKIYMDMETQYVAEKHLWWKDAVGNLNSPYSDYLLFDDAAHKIPSTMVFDLRQLNSFDGSFIKVTTVNLRNKNVLAYNKKLFGYFVDPNNDGKFDDGVDGFRLDHAMDHLDGKAALTNLFVEFWKPLLYHLKEINPLLKNVAEQADWRDYGYSYINNAGVDRVFGFGLQQAILSFDKQTLINKADTILAQCPIGNDQIIFIENHDMDRYASIEPNIDKQKLAASLMFLIGGIPSIYYGQEIGMQGKIGNWGNTDGNDIPRRAAFEWYKNIDGKGMATWYKNTGGWWNNSIMKSGDGISVEEQQNDNNSLLNYYKKMIQLKQSNAALAQGKYANAPNSNSQVFSFYRMFETEKVLVAVNLSNEMQEANFKIDFNNYRTLFGKTNLKEKTLQLSPYEVVVLKLK